MGELVLCPGCRKYRKVKHGPTGDYITCNCVPPNTMWYYNMDYFKSIGYPDTRKGPLV
jgi:hypothetical protein